MQPDAEILERLRRSGIRVDPEGNFVHEGEPVLHEGLRHALFRWLDREPDGRYVLRLDERRFAYLDVDDTPLVARSARFEGDQPWLALSDGSEETLDPSTVTVDDSGVIRCQVRGGRIEARLSTSAAAVLADHIRQAEGAEEGAGEGEAEGEGGGLVLFLGSRAHPLRTRRGPRSTE